MTLRVRVSAGNVCPLCRHSGRARARPQFGLGLVPSPSGRAACRRHRSRPRRPPTKRDAGKPARCDSLMPKRHTGTQSCRCCVRDLPRIDEPADHRSPIRTRSHSCAATRKRRGAHQYRRTAGQYAVARWTRVEGVCACRTGRCAARDAFRCRHARACELRLRVGSTAEGSDALDRGDHHRVRESCCFGPDTCVRGAPRIPLWSRKRRSARLSHGIPPRAAVLGGTAQRPSISPASIRRCQCADHRCESAQRRTHPLCNRRNAGLVHAIHGRLRPERSAAAFRCTRPPLPGR